MLVIRLCAGQCLWEAAKSCITTTFFFVIWRKMKVKHVILLWCSGLRQNVLLQVDSDVQEVDTASILHAFGDRIVHRASLPRIFIVE
jgi:hypothetical protein